MFRWIARFDVAEQWAGRAPAAAVQTVFGLACTAAFVVVRMAVDLVVPTAGPYALIYPASLLSTLFGGWRAGLVTTASAVFWVWWRVLPQGGAPIDMPRLVVNTGAVLVIVLFAEIFRAAVRSVSSERDAAFADLAERETHLRELYEDLERQVAERTRELSQTWNVSPDLLGVLNHEGYFESTNPAWQVLLGWPEATIRKTPFIEFVHPDDLERTYAAWDDVRSGLPVLRFENRYRTRDGDWRWLSWVVVPEGEKLYCSARDITAEKHDQEGLAAAQEALRQAQKMEAIGQLTGGVAHDFNNLLTVIRGSIELLQRPDLTEERRRRYIDAIAETAERATTLTGQLLAFARRQTLRPERFDVAASLEGVMAMVTSLTGSRIRLDSEVSPEPCFVKADRNQFDTAIVNMAVNARDAMDGEGQISVRVAPVSRIPAAGAHPALEGAFVAVAITDTGKGIAPEDLASIFEPFFTTKEVGAGTGLGLSQVIGFAKQSHGEVRVESVLGQGTTFTLYLPRAAAEDAPEAARPVRAAAHGDGVCVLVVEDNPQVGEFATRALNELGFESELATNAAEALARLAADSGRFHVVFSDVVMPGMNGVDMAHEIRGLYPAIPVILASGYSEVLAQSGRHDFELLQKPYSIEQLSRALHKALGRGA